MSSSESTTDRLKPLLVGLIVDVSSSMQRNWKNSDGKKLPKIEIIRDALNKQVKKVVSSSLKKRRSINFPRLHANKIRAAFIINK